MDCREMILSEDTYDIITDFSASEFLQYETNCYESIGEEFLILYLNSPGIRSPEIDFFPYHNMPKLYGLMQLMPSDADASDIFAPNTFTPDTSASQSPASEISAPGTAPFDPSSLIASGITQMQRPPLSLTGQGVILCFLECHFDFAFVFDFQICKIRGNIKVLSDFQPQIGGFYHFIFIQLILYGFIRWRFRRFRLFRSIHRQR